MLDVPVGPVDDPGDVDGVIAALDAIVDWAVQAESSLGYFAAMYRAVTVQVRDGIDSGFFDDGDRMARLDVLFANRYLRALEQFASGLEPTRSWQLAFDATQSRTPIVAQHLLVGINAHINLDLGIAVAEVAPGPDLVDLRQDFDRINEILASMVDRSQADLAQISPWLGLLDALGGRSDDELIRFSVAVARAEAWRFAQQLSRSDRNRWGPAIAVRDAHVARVGQTVLRPGMLTPVLWMIRLSESKNVRQNLRVLANMRRPTLAEVEARVRAEPGADS